MPKTVQQRLPAEGVAEQVRGDLRVGFVDDAFRDRQLKVPDGHDLAVDGESLAFQNIGAADGALVVDGDVILSKERPARQLRQFHLQRIDGKWRGGTSRFQSAG